MDEQSTQEPEQQPGRKRTFTEQLEIAGDQLVQRVRELIEEGNVRRLIIRTENGSITLEIPLTAGLAAGSLITLLSPPLAALGALAALVARARLEIVREDGEEK